MNDDQHFVFSREDDNKLLRIYYIDPQTFWCFMSSSHCHITHTHTHTIMQQNVLFLHTSSFGQTNGSQLLHYGVYEKWNGIDFSFFCHFCFLRCVKCINHLLLNADNWWHNNVSQSHDRPTGVENWSTNMHVGFLTIWLPFPISLMYEKSWHQHLYLLIDDTNLWLLLYIAKNHENLSPHT